MAKQRNQPAEHSERMKGTNRDQIEAKTAKKGEGWSKTLTFCLLTLQTVKTIKPEENWEERVVIEIITPGVTTPVTNAMGLSFFEDFGPNQLLPNGERIHYVLGNEIQRLHSGVLNEKTSFKNVKAYACNLPSCQQSAISHLMGIFPKVENNDISSDIEDLLDPPYPIDIERLNSTSALPHKMKPFDLITESDEKDVIFLTNLRKSCPYQKKKNPFWGKHGGLLPADLEWMLLKYSKQLRHLKFFGKDVGGVGQKHLSLISQSLTAFHHFTGGYFPGYKKEDLYNFQLIEGMRILGKYAGGPRRQRLYNTHKFKIILSEFAKAVKLKASPKKYILFAADRANMLALLAAFNKTSYSCLRKRLKNPSKNRTETESCRDPAPPGSSLTLTLKFHNATNKYYVSSMYNGFQLKVCQGNKYALCEYSVFLQGVKTMVTDDFFKVCGNDKVNAVEENKLRKAIRKETYALKVVAGVFVFELAVCVLICVWKNNQKNKSVVQMTLMDNISKEKFSLAK